MSLAVDTSALEVFCDYLATTHPVEDSPTAEASLWLQDHGFYLRPTGQPRVWNFYSPSGDDRPSGLCRVEEKNQYHRLSLSGAALVYLRAHHLFSEWLAFVGSYSHRVTRLDAAVDLPHDAPPLLADLHQQYPSTVNLGRKGVPVTRMLETREDGLETGTWYVGHRTRARRTLRVYDKQWERISKAGALIPPTTRVEATITRGASLRDAHSPAAIFWDVVSPAILQAPANAPAWSDNSDIGSWDAPTRPPVDRAAVERRVENSDEIGTLLAYAERAGDGGAIWAVRAMMRRAGVSLADLAEDPSG